MPRYQFFARYQFFGSAVTAVFLTLMLASCSGIESSNDPADARTPRDINEERLRGSGSILTGRSTRGINLLGRSQGGGSSLLPVNALLWRAALETVSVIPLGSVDSLGGAIISDWHADPDDSTKRIKVSIFVIDQELRSDAIRAEVHVQQLGDSGWRDAGRDGALASRLEELILTRAREIRSTSIN